LQNATNASLSGDENIFADNARGGVASKVRAKQRVGFNMV
jgi:hypothetical protein